MGPYGIIARQNSVYRLWMLLDVWLDSQPIEISIDGGCCVWVNSSLCSKRLRHTLGTELPMKSRDRKPPICDSQHTFFPPISLYPFLRPAPPPFFGLFLVPLVVRTQRGSGTCRQLSKLTCISARHELMAGKLPKNSHI